MTQQKVIRTLVLILELFVLPTQVYAMKSSCEQSQQECFAHQFTQDQLLALQVLRQLPEAELKQVLDLAKERAEVLPPLHKAAKAGDLEKVAALASCMNVSERTVFSERTALHFASSFGRSHVVKLLLEKSSDVHARDYNGMTCLHAAAADGHIEVVEVLISFGACVSDRDNCGREPEELARKKGHTATASYLAQKPKIVKRTGEARESLLRVAEMFKKGMQLGSRESIKMYLLDGLERADFESVVEETQRLMPLFDSNVWSLLLLESLYDIYGQDGCSRLLLATQLCQGGRLDFWIKRRLEMADSSEKSKELNSCIYNRTPLISAVANDGLETIDLLIKNGGLVNVPNQDGITPLMQAAIKDSPVVIEYLCSAGARIDAIDKKKFTALHYSIDEDNLAAAEILIRLIQESHPCEISDLRFRKSERSPEKPKLRDVIDLQDLEHGRSPLLTAVLRCNAKLVKALLELGANPNVIAHEEWSALRLAIMNCGPEAPSNLKKHRLEEFLRAASARAQELGCVGKEFEKQVPPLVLFKEFQRASVIEILALLFASDKFHPSESDKKFCKTWAKLYNFSVDKWLM